MVQLPETAIDAITVSKTSKDEL